MIMRLKTSLVLPLVHLVSGFFTKYMNIQLGHAFTICRLQIFLIQMSSVKQDTEYHRCSLSGEPWDIVTKFIDGGMFVNFRRALKRYTMIDKRHPLTRSYAPSLYRLKEEEKVHLIEHYSMIHPFSMFNLHFDIVCTVILLAYFTTVPIIYPVISDKEARTIILFPIYVTHVILIITTFYTGYYDTDHNVVTMDKWSVAKRYLRTYFIFDILVFLPPVLMMTSQYEKFQKSPVYGLLSSMRVLIRYVRYIWCINNLKRIRLYYGFTTFAFKTIRLLLNMVTGLALSVYVLFAILSDLSSYEVEEFLKHTESTLRMLLMVNYGRRKTMGHISELVLPSCFIIIGFMFHLIVMLETMDICFKYFSAQNQQTTIYNSINAYMRYRALPMQLRQRIYLYLEFKYQGHFYKESVIRKATSSYLRKEILLAATRDSIQKVDLFFKIPGLILKKIGAILVSEIFLPGDVIIKAGNTGQCMFFLLAGTVVVTSSEDKEICYLRDGAHFGEVALVTNIARVANVTAVTPCELFKLDRVHFWDVVKKYPTLWKDIESIVTERIANAGQSVPSSIPSTQSNIGSVDSKTSRRDVLQLTRNI